MKTIGGRIVEHEGIKLKHYCCYCDNVIYNENPDEKGWYQNWAGDWVCEACFEAIYYECKCGSILHKKYGFCVDCQKEN